MVKKVKKCLRKIFAKTFFHFFAHNFFPSAWSALKLSETAFFGVFYPWMRSKVEKIEKSFAKKNLVRKNVLEKISKFSKFFFRFFSLSTSFRGKTGQKCSFLRVSERSEHQKKSYGQKSEKSKFFLSIEKIFRKFFFSFFTLKQCSKGKTPQKKSFLRVSERSDHQKKSYGRKTE